MTKLAVDMAEQYKGETTKYLSYGHNIKIKEKKCKWAELFNVSLHNN